MDQVFIQAALQNWREFLNVITMLDEQQCKVALDIELSDKKRKNIAERLHQRYCKLRMQRERASMMEVLK
jgi:hypothetical protein